MNVLHDYEDMPQAYSQIYYDVRFKSGKELHRMVSNFIKTLPSKDFRSIELCKSLLPYRYNDEDIHSDFSNFVNYFRKTHRTTDTLTRKKVNELLGRKDFTHAHSEEEVKMFKEVLSSLGDDVIKEVNELADVEEKRIRCYQIGSSKRKRIGERINSKLNEIAPRIIEDSKERNDFFNKLKFRKNNIGFFITPEIGKDSEIVTEYLTNASRSTRIYLDDLDNESENYFVVFHDPTDQMFMSSILAPKIMKGSLEGIKLMGIPVPTIIQYCTFDGMKICEPEWSEIDFNEYYESLKSTGSLFNNRFEINIYSDDSIKYVISHLLEKTGFDSELYLACYLHFNFILPAKLYAEKRKSYFEKYNLEMSSDQFKAKRESIYQRLIIEGKTNVKWKNEFALYKLVVELYPDAIYQYRTDWLEAQSLDIYIPCLKIGIEYQGKQHYEPIEFFGGEDAFQYRQQLDNIKLQKCKDNGVILIQWDYRNVVTKTNLTRELKPYL